MKNLIGVLIIIMLAVTPCFAFEILEQSKINNEFEMYRIKDEQGNQYIIVYDAWIHSGLQLSIIQIK